MERTRPVDQPHARSFERAPASACAGLSRVQFLTTDRVLTKFFRKFALGEKSEYIDDDGNVIKMPGAQYQDNGVVKQY